MSATDRSMHSTLSKSFATSTQLKKLFSLKRKS